MATVGDVVSAATQLSSAAREQSLEGVPLRRVDRQPVFQLDGDDLGREPRAVPGRRPPSGVAVTLLGPVHSRIRDREVVQVSHDVPAPVVSDSGVVRLGGGECGQVALTSRGTSTTDVMLAGNWRTSRTVGALLGRTDRRSGGALLTPTAPGLGPAFKLSRASSTLAHHGCQRIVAAVLSEVAALDDLI